MSLCEISSQNKQAGGVRLGNTNFTIDYKFYEKSDYDNLNQPFSAALQIFEIFLNNICDGGFKTH